MKVRGSLIALSNQVTPELPGIIKLRIDLQRLGNVNAAVAAGRSVVQLAQRGVTGSGIVPGVRAFFVRHPSFSKSSIFRPGCNSFKIAANVALMMPAPMSTTSSCSGVVRVDDFIGSLLTEERFPGSSNIACCAALPGDALSHYLMAPTKCRSRQAQDPAFSARRFPEPMVALFQ